MWYSVKSHLAVFFPIMQEPFSFEMTLVRCLTYVKELTIFSKWLHRKICQQYLHTNPLLTNTYINIKMPVKSPYIVLICYAEEQSTSGGWYSSKQCCMSTSEEQQWEESGYKKYFCCFPPFLSVSLFLPSCPVFSPTFLPSSLLPSL